MSISSSIKRVPKYVRLAETIREQVRSGALKPGDQLPSYAQFQTEHGVAQATLDRVYHLLEKEKLIVRTPKQGTFVSGLPKATAKGVLGVVSGMHPQHHSYYARLLLGVQQAAYEKELPVLLYHPKANIDWGMLGGVILADVDITVPHLKPAISLMHETAGMPSFVTNDAGGTYALMRHLMELGHERIAFLTGGAQNNTDTTSIHRIEGYHEALKEAGITAKRAWVRPVYDPLEPPDDFTQVGYEKMRRWLAEDWRSLGCTAVLAHNDEVAIGVMRAFYDAGMKVPEDVSVAGFDGLELGQRLSPSLTTVDVPLTEIGLEGARSIFARMETMLPAPNEVEATVTVLPGKLRVGESTAPPSR